MRMRQKGPYLGAISKKFMRAPESQRLQKTDDSTKKAIVALRIDLTQCRGTRIPDETRTPAVEQKSQKGGSRAPTVTEYPA